MRAKDTLDALAAGDEDGGARLACPAVGEYLHPPAKGELLSPGESCGWLRVLGAVRPLVVPDGVAGRVRASHPGARGAGETLLELDAVEAGAAAAAVDDVRAEDGALLLRAPLDGRFYRRPAPDVEAYVQDGDLLEAGRAVGMLEVMKTFSPLHYQPGGGLPTRARLVRFLVEDGDEVAEGQPLAELEADGA